MKDQYTNVMRYKDISLKKSNYIATQSNGEWIRTRKEANFNYEQRKPQEYGFVYKMWIFQYIINKLMNKSLGNSTTASY